MLENEAWNCISPFVTRAERGSYFNMASRVANLNKRVKNTFFGFTWVHRAFEPYHLFKNDDWLHQTRSDDCSF